MLATTNVEPGLALDSKQFTKCTRLRLRDRSMDCIPNTVNKAIVSCMHMYKVHNNWKLRYENFKDSSRNALLLFKNWSYSRTVREHFYKSLNFGKKIKKSNSFNSCQIVYEESKNTSSCTVQ